MEKFNKKFLIKAAIAGVSLLFALGLFLFGGKSEEKLSLQDSSDFEIEETASSSGVTEVAEELPKEIIVHVDGQVALPQVIKLPDGSRIYEAIEKAGGLTANADSKQINMAMKLNDGEKIYVPSLGEPVSIINQANAGASSPISDMDSGLVNINTATSLQLQTLQGVGPSTAEKIINYRNSDGMFEKIEDLKNVSGIGDKTFKKFMDKICVN